MKAFRLDENPKIKTGFSTPDGYFDQFPAQMMQILGNQKKIKAIPLHSRRHSWIFAAAAVLVLSLSLPVINGLTDESKSGQSQIDDYLAYQNFSDEDIVSLLETEDIAKIKIDYTLEDKAIEDELPADIENYILD